MSRIDYSVSDGLCVLRLNAPPVNTVTFELLADLGAAIRRAADDEAVAGIVLTGTDKHFSAGADVGIFHAITTAEQCIETSRVFQEAFDEIARCPKPVAAAVAGKMMGSAVEMAMACHWRVAAIGTRFSFPEVTLAINPGAGGTQRLPRLIGPGEALDMLLTARAIDADRAMELGLVDDLCPPESIVDRAGEIVRSGGPVRRTRDRTDKVDDPAANRAAFEQARRLVEAGRPEIVAPAKILDAVRVGLTESFEAGLRAEQTGFADCMDTTATRSKLHVFFATRDTGKAPELAGAKAAEIGSAAVVGMGSMGTGIAHAMIIAGIPVTVVDADEGALERGMGRIQGSIGRRVEQGKMSAGRAERMLALLNVTTDYQGLADADLIVEAVFENVPAKHAVLTRIERHCRDDAILATNTSTLSLDVLAEPLADGDRLVGLHFFNPAHRMPLVEVIRREATPPDVLATALAVVKRLRKTPVIAANREGFIVNRIFVPYFKEAFFLLEDGAEPKAIDEAMVAFGFPMGPLTLIDMAGLDILAHVDEVMARAYPAHGRLSRIALGLVDQGNLGQKTGAGVYKYEQGDRRPAPSDLTERLIAEVRDRRGPGGREMTTDEITRRLVLRMVAEAFRVMAEKVARCESDVDAAMVLGTGFPDFRGGVLRYARDLGLSEVLGQLEELEAAHGERFRPCRLLKEIEGVR
jgi:3-hydroxyacyl-CoA dehydrogenase